MNCVLVLTEKEIDDGYEKLKRFYDVYRCNKNNVLKYMNILKPSVFISTVDDIFMIKRIRSLLAKEVGIIIIQKNLDSNKISEYLNVGVLYSINEPFCENELMRKVENCIDLLAVNNSLISAHGVTESLMKNLNDSHERLKQILKNNEAEKLAI
jgi:hypothetical protein